MADDIRRLQNEYLRVGKWRFHQDALGRLIAKNRITGNITVLAPREDGVDTTVNFAYYDNHITDDPEMSVALTHSAIPDSIAVYLNGVMQRFDFDYQYTEFDDNYDVTEVTLYSDMEAEAGDLLEIRYAYRV